MYHYMHPNVETADSLMWCVSQPLANSAMSSFVSHLQYNKTKLFIAPYTQPSLFLASVPLFKLFLPLVIFSFNSTFLFNLLEST